MKVFSLLVLIAALCGCQGMHPREAHLSKREALSIAQEVATDHQERLERYRAPEVHFDTISGQWRVSFHQKTSYTYGRPETYNYFGVTIDDKTGKATYEPFVLK